MTRILRAFDFFQKLYFRSSPFNAEFLSDSRNIKIFQIGPKMTFFASISCERITFMENLITKSLTFMRRVRTRGFGHGSGATGDTWLAEAKIE